MKGIFFLILISTVMLFEVKEVQAAPKNYEKIKGYLNSYSPTKITADISHLTYREKQLIKKLAEVGHLADAIFWKQSCPDAVAVRDSLAKLTDEVSQTYYKYVKVNYGPYDKLDEYNRFVGTDAEKRPPVGGFYPADLTKEEFEKYIAANPDQKNHWKANIQSLSAMAIN